MSSINCTTSTNNHHSHQGKRHDFSGIWVALVTPFTATTEAAIDFPALQALAKKLIADGATGLVVCGSTGEASLLSAEEQLEVLDAVLAVVPAHQIIMGLSGNHMPQVMDRMGQISQRRLAGVLATAPHYIRPSQAGILQYFHTLADASGVPVLIYNIPYRTGVNMELPTLRALARHPNIVAIKDCGGNLQATMQLIVDGDIQVLTGEDVQIFNNLCLGGAGGIMASAHLRIDLFMRMLADVNEGRLVEARTMFHHLLPLMQATFEEPNPAPLKAVLASIYPMQATLRAPMMTATAEMQDKIKAAYRRLHDIK